MLDDAAHNDRRPILGCSRHLDGHRRTRRRRPVRGHLEWRRTLRRRQALGDRFRLCVPVRLPAGQSNFYTAADASHAVVRFLSRATGRPVNTRDVETFYPLICPGNSPWDPDGTGATGQPPLKLDPNQLAGIKSFDADAATVTPVRGDYVRVTLPVSDGTGNSRSMQFTLSIGPRDIASGPRHELFRSGTERKEIARASAS